jgi:hypothetical protein
MDEEEQRRHTPTARLLRVKAERWGPRRERRKVPLWTRSRSQARRAELRLATRDLHDEGRQRQT